MYNNMVFDLGGVVVDYDPKDYLTDRFFYERIENRLYNDVFGSKEWEKLDRGEITFEEAAGIFQQRGEEHDIAFEMQALLDNWQEMLTTRRATVHLMRLFKKKGFHVYYLSNIAQETLGYLQRKNFWSLFDGGVASCEVGLCKPEPEIYRQLLDKYQLVPQETIFADDNRGNAEAAFQAGITGIHFKNVKSFCKMLITYGIEI